MTTEDNTQNQGYVFEPNKKNPSSLTPLTIFFAVLAAIVVAYLLKEAYDEYRTRQALAQFDQEMRVFNSQMNQEIRKMQIQNDRMMKQNLNNVEKIYQGFTPPDGMSVEQADDNYQDGYIEEYSEQ